MRTRKIQDGMFFAGMTIVGDKYLGDHIFSTGELHTTSLLKYMNFSREFVHNLNIKLTLCTIAICAIAIVALKKWNWRANEYTPREMVCGYFSWAHVYIIMGAWLKCR
jgi:hypothetical protein